MFEHYYSIQLLNYVGILVGEFWGCRLYLFVDVLGENVGMGESSSIGILLFCISFGDLLFEVLFVDILVEYSDGVDGRNVGKGGSEGGIEDDEEE